MNIIAIDIGTTNLKALIVTDKNKVVKSFHLPAKPVLPKPGWNEQEPVNIFNTVLKLLQQSFRFCKEENVLCVCFSAAMHSLIAVDKKGKPLMNMITWADLRSAEYAKSLKNDPVSKKIYETTGVPIHAMSPLCKLLWLRHEKRNIFKSAYKFISIKEYIFFRLFGKYLIDYSIAAATGLFDEKKLCWYPESLKMAGISKEQLSTLMPVEHFEIRLIPSIRKKLNTRNDVPFVLGASDGALANLGCGITNTANAAITVGTSGAVRVTSPKYLIDKKQRLFCYYITDGMYVTGGAINNGGIVLQWMVEKVLQQDFGNEKKLNQLIKATSKIKAGSDGLILLPYIMGERSPVWDGEAKAAFVGLTASHTKLHLIKAALEGVCFSLADVLKALEEVSNNIKNLFLSGGITQSDVWVQMLSDITGKKIMVNEIADASALGAAFIGMKAMGSIKKIEEAKRFQKQIKVFHPNKQVHHIYKKYFEVYRGLYTKLKTTFDALAFKD